MGKIALTRGRAAAERLAPLALALLAASAWAQESPRFCPTRPSLGESGCTTEPGHVHLEGSLVDWTKDEDASWRDDTVLVGDFQARFGLTRSAELQVAWTPNGHDRTRDKASGAIDRAQGAGDVRIGLRRNLKNPDGMGLSFAIEPSVTLPVGKRPIGARDWGAGVVVPVTFDLSDKLNLALTNDVEAAPDEDGKGRHFLLNEVVGLGYDLSDKVTAVAEVQVVRDNDPLGHETQAFAAASLAWQPTKRTQLDVLVGAGLNRAAPDLRILTGGAVLF